MQNLKGNLLLFKFGPHTKSGLTIPQCDRRQRRQRLSPSVSRQIGALPDRIESEINAVCVTPKEYDGCLPQINLSWTLASRFPNLISGYRISNLYIVHINTEKITGKLQFIVCWGCLELSCRQFRRKVWESVGLLPCRWESLKSEERKRSATDNAERAPTLRAAISFLLLRKRRCNSPTFLLTTYYKA